MFDAPRGQSENSHPPLAAVVVQKPVSTGVNPNGVDLGEKREETRVI